MKKKQNKQLTNTVVQEIRTRVKRGDVVQALQMLADEYGGELTPHQVVHEAKDPKHILHSQFEWDDKRAGDRYRLIQARILLTTVKVEYMGETRDAFFNAKVTIGDETTRAYFPIARVMSDKNIREQVLRDAISELEFAQRKYASLQELTGVINTEKLAKVKKKLGKGK